MQNGTHASTSWDHSVDLLIVGSGAGAMATGICAHDRGGNALLIEKTALYGGSSAMSGGSLWIPNNHLMAAAGVNDSPEEALTYLKHITRGAVAEEKLQRYVRTAPEMLRYFSERGRLRMQSMLTYTDYYPEAPGGKPGGRSVEPEHFDARELGDDFERLREPAIQELVMGRMSMTATEAHHLLARHPGWIGLTSKIMSRYWLDVGGRMKGKRDRCLSLGNALVGMLRRTMLDRNMPLWLETAARELVVEGDRVVGLVAEQRGRTIRIRAEKGARARGRRLREQRRHAEAVPPEPDRRLVDDRQPRQHRRRDPDGPGARRRHRSHGRRLVGPDDRRPRRAAGPHAGHREGPAGQHLRQQARRALRERGDAVQRHLQGDVRAPHGRVAVRAGLHDLRRDLPEEVPVRSVLPRLAAARLGAPEAIEGDAVS